VDQAARQRRRSGAGFAQTPDSNDHHGLHEISYMQRSSYRNQIMLKAVRSQTHNLKEHTQASAILAY
jgi:hypothetical protein